MLTLSSLLYFLEIKGGNVKMGKFKKITGLTLGIMVFSSAFASAAWSDPKTFQLDSSDGWEVKATDGSKMSSYKSTNSTSYEVHTMAKTMWSNPSARLVNSNNDVRSHTVTTPDAGRTVTGSGNTGTKGYYYYGSVKPAWNQSGTDTIKLQVKAD